MYVTNRPSISVVHIPALDLTVYDRRASRQWCRSNRQARAWPRGMHRIMRGGRCGVVPLLLGVVSCGAESNAPRLVESTRAPVATSTVGLQTLRPLPNCKDRDRTAVEGGAGSGGAPIDGGAAVPIIDADRTIASLRPFFRACYQVGLESDSQIDGCVLIRARVTPDGSVSTADAIVTDRLSPDVIKCLVRCVREAQFSAPGGGGSTLDVPITFIQAQRDSRPTPKR